MFDIQYCSIQEFLDSCVSVDGEGSLSKEKKDFRKSLSVEGKYKFVDGFVPEFPCYFPSCYLFGNLIHGVEVDSKLNEIVPGKFFKMGSLNNSERIVKLSKLRSSCTSLSLVIYYYCEYGAVDLSSYINYFLESGKDEFMLTFVVKGNVSMSYRFFSTDFALNPDYLVSVQAEVDDFVNIDTNLLVDYLNSDSRSVCSDKVVLDTGKKFISLKVFPLIEMVIMKKVTKKKGRFGGLNGIWVSCFMGEAQFRFFLTEEQAYFKPYDWAHCVLYSLFKDKYMITPVNDLSVLDESIKVCKISVTALETCHQANDLKCDVYSAFKKFEFNSCGKFNMHSARGCDSYSSAYTNPPRVCFASIGDDRLHYHLPCGVCVKEGCGKMKKKHAAVLRNIRNFNYGVKNLSSSMNDVYGSSVVVTSSSYGVMFVKYQSSSMLPGILQSYEGIGLCGCSLSKECSVCNISDLIGLIPVSMLKGKFMSDWNDRFKVFVYSGRHYVCENLEDIVYDNISFKGVDSPVKKLVARENAVKLIADMYKDCCCSNPMSFLYKNKSSVTSGAKVNVNRMKQYLRVQEKRFFGILSVLKRSSPYKGSKNIWVVVQHYNSRFYSAYKCDYTKAAKEFVRLYSFLKEYDRDNPMSDEDLGVLRSELFTLFGRKILS